MLHNKVVVGILGAVLLAVSCHGSALHAAVPEQAVDRGAAASCDEEGDASRIEQCFTQLPLVSPAHARQEDPDVHAAVDAWMEALRSAEAVHAQDLAAKGDVRSLLAAAAIMSGQSVANEAPETRGLRAREWMSRARARGPADPLVAWVEHLDCYALECDRGATLERLLLADGGNAAAHLSAMAIAIGSGDAGTAREHLHVAASTSHFDPHASQLLGLLLEANSGVPTPAMDASVSSALSATVGAGAPVDVMAMQSLAHWSAFGGMPWAGVAGLCSPESPELTSDPALRGECVRVLTMLADDDSMLVQALFAVRHLGRMDPALATQWAARTRQLAWLGEQSIPLLDGRGPVAGAEYAGWIAQHGELGALSRLLARAGIAPAPPSDWTPSLRFR